ncbi:hypothetical protein ABZ622_41380 [Streptomyces sp. NPDC007164]
MVASETARMLEGRAWRPSGAASQGDRPRV